MFGRAILLVYAVKCMVQTAVILSPEFNDVLENSTLELTCQVPKKGSETKWRTSEQLNSFSTLTFSKEGVCEKYGFLNETKYFETRCYSNATFKVKIKRVNISNHGQEWTCSQKFSTSNVAFIFVQVPIKYVTIKSVAGDSLITVEKKRNSFHCETSEGRPGANITWIKVSEKGIRTDLTDDVTYNVTRTEISTERNLTIVNSSIHIEPVREDNDARIICEATNMKLYVVRKEITIRVQYPSGKPYFQFIGKSEFLKNGTVLTNKIILEETSSFIVVCKADGYPTPTCTWIVDSDIKSPSLTFTNISKGATGLYKCFAENIIKGSFPANIVKTNTSADLEIDVQYQSRVVVFYIIGHEQTKDVFKITENETLIFNCSVDSNPESSIALSFRGKELGHVFSADTLLHSRQMTSCFDDGDYNCTAQNNFNNKPSFKTLRLHVKCKPRVSPEFILKSTVSTAWNLTVTFEFKAIANPKPEFKWFKLRGTFWRKISTGNKYKIETTGLSSNLTVRSITKDDYGYYKLEMENEVGSSEQMYFLKSNEDQEQDSLESSVPRILLFVAVGTLGLILATALVFFGYRHSRREGSERQQTGEVIENQTTASNDDDTFIYDDIDESYDHLDERFKERTVYMEMQIIETDDSLKDYITPII